MKKRFVIAFFYAEKCHILWYSPMSMDTYGDQTVNVGTVRQWVMHFNIGDSNVSHKLRSIRLSIVKTARTRPMKDGLRKKYLSDTIIATVKKWIAPAGIYFLRAQLVDPCSFLGKMNSQWWRRYGKWCFIAESLLYPTMLLCSLKLIPSKVLSEHPLYIGQY